MAERYDILVKVVSQKGTCKQEHKVGEQWVVKAKTPEGICLSAFNSLYPHIRSLRYGGESPLENDPDVAPVACPDPFNPVVFEVRRLRKQSGHFAPGGISEGPVPQIRFRALLYLAVPPTRRRHNMNRVR